MKNNSTVTKTSVLIVGAGPAGLGVGLALQQAGVSDFLIVDSREIGAAFRSWPRGMALLTPSFNSNSFGLTDLNSIDPHTSPADFLNTQHPQGPSYASYLEAVAEHYQLPVQTKVNVTNVTKESSRFYVETSQGTIQATYLVWAAGQFFYPRNNDFTGAKYALHSSTVEDWSKLEGDHFTVIGGYESGVDAALNLIHNGKSVQLISRGEPWASDHPDPSRSLSPRTLDRLRAVLQNPEQAQKLELTKNTTIESIEQNDGFWTLRDQDNIPLACKTRPILANGFYSGLRVVANFFDYDQNDLPIFSEEADESTITSGLFYSGPSLVHRNSLFCFIYKFRARFGVIAAEIAHRLGLPDIEENMQDYVKAGFMNVDLDCCTNCECAIETDPSDTPQPDSFHNT